ncbi:hypothetical protein [Haloarcula salinisoli]|uniref:Uncharacterized protein n=1 Tax=Haloarcula salinisoli TaxID=2487746 RepID=A0A8J7YK69_9EURY|nr:hypothetical protein [Halomicroarcula salinisoli]MBX0287873.1 hypothetical protein [Halomicroarcula salinisoli]MBX0304816.1 hypothetical protein [Halomicroarcula salinisoli]
MTALRPADDRLLNWSHETIALLLTVTVLLGSLTMTATALGDPELVAVLAALGCGLALLGLGLTALNGRVRSLSTPAGV